MIRWFAILFVLGTQGSSQIAWAETYPINNVKMVVTLLRNPLVSLERNQVVNLSRNQVVNFTEISTKHPYLVYAVGFYTSVAIGKFIGQLGTVV